jgi:kynurenine formamidase
VREADGYKFSSATMSLAMGDHADTHVDAPYHFDARPHCGLQRGRNIALRTLT